MPIKIEITADTVAEMEQWAKYLAQGTVIYLPQTPFVAPDAAPNSFAASLSDPSVDAARIEELQETVAELTPAVEQPVKRRGRPPKTETPAPVEEPAAPTPAPATAVDYEATLDDCMDVMRRVSASISFEATRQLLTDFGVPKISQLAAEKRTAFVAEGLKRLAEAS